MEIDSRQRGTGHERKVPKIGEAFANHDVGQAGAILERVVPYGRDAVRDYDAG